MTDATGAHAEKVERLRAELGSLPSLAVALSGGVDSSVLAHAAGKVLGRRALAVTAVSPSVSAEEIAVAEEVAGEAGIEHLKVETRELEDPRYARNDGNRCYFCKAELFAVMERIAREREIAAIAYGAITDDLRDFRPGARAASEFRVLAPLVAAGFAKEDVRRYAREAGLPNAGRPASACLASRIPYGTFVTAEALARVGALEARLRALGYALVRVRHHGDLARIEVSPDRIEDAAIRDGGAILAAGRESGYSRVAIDLRGYRQGAMNEALAARPEQGSEPPLPPDVAEESWPSVLLLRADVAAREEVLRRREEIARLGRPFAALDLAPG
ncbi:MAG TPA: ATP-dependent sacrificial sulfur transferase LarE [Planctomycetota bacterium]|nr:ATP-dependent sacrificial sulfur transferase LarE [Planctomycetota bacterium]